MMGRRPDAAATAAADPDAPFAGCPAEDNAYEQLQAYWRLAGVGGADDAEGERSVGTQSSLRNALKWKPARRYSYPAAAGRHPELSLPRHAGQKRQRGAGAVRQGKTTGLCTF